MRPRFPFEASSEWARGAGAAGQKVWLRVCHGLSRPVILTIGERKGHWRGLTADIEGRLWQRRLQRLLLLLLLSPPAAAADPVFLLPFPPTPRRRRRRQVRGNEQRRRPPGMWARSHRRSRNGVGADLMGRARGGGSWGRRHWKLWGSSPAVRPRSAAAAEPEGRRAGLPSPRVPCRCPDLPPASPGPSTRSRCGPLARLPPLKTTDHLRILPQKLQGNFVPPAQRFACFLSSYQSSWGICRAPASGRPGPGSWGVRCGGVGWGGVRERERPSHLSDLPQMLLMMPLIHSAPSPPFSTFRHWRRILVPLIHWQGRGEWGIGVLRIL